MSGSTLINEGIWIDWDRGRLAGLTLTMTTRNAAVLIAFISLYTSVAGTFLWRLVKFITHQLKAHHKSKTIRDGHWASQMVILRNSSTPAQVLLDAVRALLAWRTLTMGSFTLIVLATVFAPLLAAVSILSSKVIEPDLPLGRLKSDACGYWNITDSAEFRTKLILNESLPAASYSDACYEGSTNSILCSHSYVQPSLAFDHTLSNPCPFGYGVEGNSLCIGPVITMDSGYIDTRKDLGVNTRDEDRLYYRHVSTCAPINTTGYTNVSSKGFGPGGSTKDQVEYFLLGPVSNNSYTYWYNYAEYYGQGGYDLATVFYYANLSEDTYVPIEPLLATPDADVTLFFLASNQVQYPKPVDDPWFAAHNNWSGASDTYYSDLFVSVLACIDQNQICLNEASCTEFLGSTQVFNAAASLDTTITQSYLLNRLANLYLPFAVMYDAVAGRGSGALQASKTVFQGNGYLSQVELPTDQWQLEVMTWFDLQMARLQRSFVESSIGPDVSSLINKEWAFFDDPLCGSQLIPLPVGFQSLNFAAILLVLFIGAIFMFLGATVPSIVVYIGKRRQRNSPGWLAWTLDNKFQLLRLAQESAGWGLPWQKQLNTVPRSGGQPQIGAYRVGLPGVDTSYIERAEIVSLQSRGQVTYGNDPYGIVQDGPKSPVDTTYSAVYMEEH